MTLVIAVRGLDISVGAVVAIAAAVAALMIGGSFSADGAVASKYPLWLALATALAVAAACGLWNGLLVVKAGMQPIVATLILMVAGRGIAQLLTGGQIITIYYAPFFTLGNGFLLGLPIALWIAALTWAALHLALSRTALGLFVRAIGGNPEAARVAGVRSSAITLCVYTFCGFAAGIAGLIVSSNVKSADANNAGQLLELDAILAVTLGGTALTGGRFTLAGTILGALIIQTLTSMIYSLGVPPEVNLVVKAALVFAVMLLQSAEFRALVRARAPRISAARDRAMMNPVMNRRLLPLAVTMALFVAMAAFGALRYDGFLSPQVFLNLIIDNAFLCIVAVGMTFVILSGGIDLSVGAVIALTTMISAIAAESGLEPVRRDGGGAGVRRCIRRVAGLPDPALQSRALHRHPRRHVLRARLLLPDQHGIHSDRRCDLHRDRAGAHSARGRALHSPSAASSRSRWSRSRCAWRMPPGSGAPCMRSAAAKRRRGSWASRWIRPGSASIY